MNGAPKEATDNGPVHHAAAPGVAVPGSDHDSGNSATNFTVSTHTT